MTIKNSGQPLSFSEIVTEFGNPSSVTGKTNLGGYRVSESYGSLSGLRLDSGMPGPGEPIKFSDFYSKRLNVVVDLYSIPNFSTRLIARNQYDNRAVSIVGGFKEPADLPTDGSGKRILVNVNKSIGSSKTNRNCCALRTGSWGSDVTLEVIVGPSGALYGSGGDGGNGGNSNSTTTSTTATVGAGRSGGQGTSALGLQYPTIVINQGIISSGRGGGGGGGSAYGAKHADVQKGCDGRQTCGRVGGGGGAGGRGYPAGIGGLRGNITTGCDTKDPDAQNGTSATLTTDGIRGGGGKINTSGSCRQEGRSGRGGSAENVGLAGSSYPNSAPGAAGSRGYAIIIDSSGSLISLSGNPPLEGNTVNGPVL